MDDLPACTPLIEYRGKVMLREQYDKENIHPARCLAKLTPLPDLLSRITGVPLTHLPDLLFHRRQPHVLFYRKFDQQDLCIDATVYGNDARFVRRSCTPNAEVRHLLDKNNVHFVIYSTQRICNGAEVTVPFDFNYQEW